MPDVPDNDYQLIAEFPDHESQSPNETDYDQQPNPVEFQRSTRESKKPNFYGQEYFKMCKVLKPPMSYQEAAVGLDKEKSEVAMR